MKILVINPGSSSTKLGVFEDETPIHIDDIRHEEDTAYNDEVTYRTGSIDGFLKALALKISDFGAVVARGGLLKPLKGGVYSISKMMLDDLRSNRYGRHASNLGAQLAAALTEGTGLPMFIVDPVSVDEFWAPSRFSGHPDIPRRALAHTLNIKSVVRRACGSMKRDITKTAFVVAHMGSGTSVAAVLGGRIVDVNNANDEGPFSAERCGGLPTTGLLNWLSSSQTSPAEAVFMVTRKGGLKGYLGTGDVRAIQERVASGDDGARAVIEAMCYQVSKELGAMAAALGKSPEAILLTGGMASSDLVCSLISERISYLAPVMRYPGENELQALASGCLRALRGDEPVLEY